MNIIKLIVVVQRSVGNRGKRGERGKGYSEVGRISVSGNGVIVVREVRGIVQ